MKKVFFYFLALFACAACTTDNDTPVTPDESVQVTFNVSSLDVDVQPMHARTRAVVPAGDVLTTIHYCLTNTKTYQVYTGSQTLAESGDDFGTIKLWLPKGTYKTTFFGFGESNPAGSATFRYDKDYKYCSGTIKNKDGFVAKDDATTITADATDVEINLSRFTSALVIRLNDEVPDDFGKIKIELPFYPVWDFDSEQASNETNTGYKTDFSDYLTIKNAAVEEYTYYVLPQNNLTLTLTIYNKTGEELGATSVPVSFYKNRKTIVSGNLLDVIQQKPFAISVTDDWGTDNVISLK